MASNKILLIDDMKGIRESLDVILTMQGYSVECAKNGVDGLRMAQLTRYELIITDILMPELDGNEVVIKLRELGNETPVLAVSAGGDGVSASQALTLAKQKATAVMEKPFSKEELLHQIKQLIH